MKDYRNKLHKLSTQSRWKMRLFALVVNLLLFWQTAIDYYYYLNFNFLFARRAFVKRTRQRAHWVGSQIAKPHRLAFIALAAILIAGVFTAPRAQTALYWVIGWGSAFSLFVIYQSLSIILQRVTNQPNQRTQN